MTSYHLEDYDFVSLSKHAKKRRVHERLLILAHVKTGKTLTQAADALFVGKPVVKRCLKNFFSKGLKGLEDKPRSGRPTRLAAAHHKDLITLIEASHTSASGGRLIGQDIGHNPLRYQKLQGIGRIRNHSYRFRHPFFFVRKVQDDHLISNLGVKRGTRNDVLISDQLLLTAEFR